MNFKIAKIFEIGYLLIAAFFVYKAVEEWSAEESRSVTFLILGALAVFMYFFRRKMRLKQEGYHQNKK